MNYSDHSFDKIKFKNADDDLPKLTLEYTARTFVKSNSPPLEGAIPEELQKTTNRIPQSSTNDRRPWIRTTQKRATHSISTNFWTR